MRGQQGRGRYAFSVSEHVDWGAVEQHRDKKLEDQKEKLFPAKLRSASVSHWSSSSLQVKYPNFSSEDRGAITTLGPAFIPPRSRVAELLDSSVTLRPF